jgi:hypothetical protein
MPLRPSACAFARRLLIAAASAGMLSALPAPARAVELKPLNLVPPAITGAPVVGQPLACSQGLWTGPPSAYAYQWTRDGADVAGATLASYVVVPSDVGKSLRCRVTASNSVGSAQATSPPVVGLGIGSSPDPAPTSPPGAAPSRPESGELIRLPSNRRCLSSRNFRIRVRRVPGVRLAAVAVYVNRKPVEVARGKRLTARIDLRGLPRGTVRVRIEAATTDGRVIRDTRKYHVCVKRRGPKRKHRL